MARPKIGRGPDNLRAELAAKKRQSHRDWYDALPELEEPPCYEADDLDAGLPVVVAGWELTQWFPAPKPFAATDWVRVEPDGSLTRVQAVKKGPGDLITWVPG